MIRVALKGLLGRKLRAMLTAFAIVLGVAMISGAFVLTDTLGKSFDGIYTDTYKAADAVVSSTKTVKAENGDSKKVAFSAQVLQQIQDLPGVQLAQGTIEDESRLVDRTGKPIGGAANGIAVGVDPHGSQRLNPLQLVSGRWPSGDHEIALDTSTARKHHFAPGQTVGAFGEGPLARYRISGIVRFGTENALGGATISVFDLATAQRLFHKQGRLDLIRIAARDGVTAAQVVAQARPLLTASERVRSSADQAKADSKDTQADLSFVKYFLLGFGGIALFVGGFVIANTLAITVAQRMRELATLRTLGASRRQVLISVVLESIVIGLLGSIAGLFLGLGIAKGLTALLEASGLELPSSSLVLSMRTIVLSIGTGTLIALLASLRPASRATRVEPIAAVREGATMPASRFARFAPVASGVVGALALALFGYGAFASDVEIKLRMATLIGGVLLLFVGVAMIANRVVRPLAFILGAPAARLGGAPGRLARQNAVRNPSRTASTAAAVMIGLSLITFVAVLGSGLKSSFTTAVNQQFVGDYAVSAGKGAVLTPEAAARVAGVPGVEAVSQIRTDEAKLGRTTVQVTGVDADLMRVVEVPWSTGSDDLPGKLGRNGTIVVKRFADDHALVVGSPLVLHTSGGKTLHLRVKGILDPPKGGSPVSEVSISNTTFDRTYVDHRNDLTLVNVHGGPSEQNTARLEQSLTAFPSAVLETRDEFKASRTKQIGQSLKMLYALLGLSVIVSLFGVINTLVLSVFERTREIGMLRAVGMTRSQVRRMIRQESIVTALIGAALGIGVGLFLAALTTRAIAQYGIGFAVPYGTLIVFVGVAVAAGTLAAILPARRASRLDVLQALQYE
jgi:putative ABC transport system permease protein